MKKQHLKYYIGIILIFVIDLLHVWFKDNNERYDVYLFHDHTRYFTNILYDISNMFRFSLITFWLIRISRKVFTPLFILSIGWWVSYFLNYNQTSSILLIPLYILAMVYFNKNKSS